MKLGESLEDYLETMLILEESGKIRSVDVAKHLNVSKPSVNNALCILKEKGYVTQENYKDIHLTEAGRKEAQLVFERHIMLRTFLIDILKVDDKQADIDACKIEHIISEETFQKFKQYYHKQKKES